MPLRRKSPGGEELAEKGFIFLVLALFAIRTQKKRKKKWKKKGQRGGTFASGGSSFSTSLIPKALAACREGTPVVGAVERVYLKKGTEVSGNLIVFPARGP